MPRCLPLDASNEALEGGVVHDIVQRLPMCCGHQLHSPLGNGGSGMRLSLAANLINHNHLRHVVLHRFNHCSVLLLWHRDLRANVRFWMSCLTMCYHPRHLWRVGWSNGASIYVLYVLLHCIHISVVCTALAQAHAKGGSRGSRSRARHTWRHKKLCHIMHILMLSVKKSSTT